VSLSAFDSLGSSEVAEIWCGQPCASHLFNSAVPNFISARFVFVFVPRSIATHIIYLYPGGRTATITSNKSHCK
jgi:hypothetical protein